MGNFLYFIKQNKLNILIILCYLAITVFTLFYHEIWCDEAQAWCLVRDLGFIDIIKSTRIEGHPLLWYFLLMPFAKMGFSVVSMQILSLLLVLSAVIYFVFKSPFNNLFKILAVFSSGMLYYLPSIARNYALIPILIFLLAGLYKERKKHPYIYTGQIILLSQTHILMFGFCAVLFFIYSIEQIKDYLTDKTEKLNQYRFYIPYVVCGIYFILLAFMFLDAAGKNESIIYNVEHNVFSINQVISNISKIMFLFKDNIIDVLIFSFTAIFVLIDLFKQDKKLFVIFLMSSGFIIEVLHKVWAGGIIHQKIFLIYLIMLFCYWNVNQKYNLFKIGLYVFFIFNFIASPFVVYSDYKYNFSGSKQIAEYIKKNLNSEKTYMVVGLPFLWSSISAYLPDVKLYSFVDMRYISYNNYRFQDEDKIDKIPKTDFCIAQKAYENSLNSGLKKIFETDKHNLSNVEQQEIFIIYQIE